MKILPLLPKLKSLGPRTWYGKTDKFGLAAIRELRHISLEEAQRRLHELSSCDIKGLVVPYTVCEEEGRIFVIRPWIEGAPLEPVIDAETACRILELLSSVPSEFIICDLRPEHLIKQGQKIILCDPGFEERGHSPYCAPEQVNRGDIGPGVLDYQLGATLYHLLSGHQPADAQTLLIPDVELEPIPALSSRLNKQISRLFEADPRERPLPSDILPDFRDWANRLRQEEKQLKKKKKKRRWSSSEEYAAAAVNIQLAKPPATKSTAVLAIESEYADDADPVAASVAQSAGALKQALKNVDWSVVAMVALPLIGTLCVGSLLFYSGVVSNDEKAAPIAKDLGRPAPTLENLPQSWVSPKDGAPMILIPAGPYYSGPVPAAGSAARPFVVELPAFYIDRYEVTNRQFKKFVEATGYKAQGNWEEAASDDRLDHPVIRVSFYDCEAYARWAGKRLPTANEWEKAARGGDLRLYPWGGREPDYTRFNCVESGLTNTSEVGTFPRGASPYGVEDMAGNVWEWVDTWFIPYGAAAEYTPLTKVIKGGSRSDSAVECVLTQEHGVLPEQGRLANSGFRCVFDPLSRSEGKSEKEVKPKQPSAQPVKKLRSLEQLTPKVVKNVAPAVEVESEVPADEATYNYYSEGDYNPEFEEGGYDQRESWPEEEANSNEAAVEENGDNYAAESPKQPEFINRTESGEIIPNAPADRSNPPQTVIPDFSKGSSSGYVDEDKVNYYE
ncbi:MAG: SUMF1/EgtB/PvdO family nonheme iron enzyme [Candidatus Bruticola sp.]